jgi:2,4-dienoyl-CoA reductase-like NADH-dependent reductase (Old Yellow Enzyme family)
MATLTNLFSKLTLGNLTLKNRLTMAPLYLGYAGGLLAN